MYRFNFQRFNLDLMSGAAGLEKEAGPAETKDDTFI
jgi:hypothetical protein